MKYILPVLLTILNIVPLKAQSAESIKSINRHNAESVIGFLASDAMRGREAGSQEGKIAGEYLASRLKDFGIQPLGSSYFQNFEAVQAVSKKNMRWQSHPDSLSALRSGGVYRTLQLRNVLGMIPGQIKDEFVIVGAHYDHLGTDKYISGDGTFNGADDNASGVSAVLQIAKAFVTDGTVPRRNVIFAFWDGEEKGLLGSQFFTATYPAIRQVKSYLNFDMIGRNTNEAKPKHVVFFYTASHPAFGSWLKNDIKKYQLNLEPDYRPWENPVGGSDNGSFAKAGVPILWYHTDAHKDYHQPTDTPEKLNWEKLVDITKAAYLNAWKMANEKSY